MSSSLYFEVTCTPNFRKLPGSTFDFEVFVEVCRVVFEKVETSDVLKVIIDELGNVSELNFSGSVAPETITSTGFAAL